MTFLICFPGIVQVSHIFSDRTLEDDADIDYIEEAWMRAGESEVRLMVRDALECLDEAHRQTIRMYYWEDYTCREISKMG